MKFETKIPTCEMRESLVEDAVKKYLELEKRKTESFISKKYDELEKLNQERIAIRSIQERDLKNLDIGAIVAAVFTGLFLGAALFPLSVMGKIITIIIEIITSCFVVLEIKENLPSKKGFLKNGVNITDPNELQEQSDRLTDQSKAICNQIANAKDHVVLCDKLLSCRNVLAELDLDSLIFTNSLKDNCIQDKVNYANIHFDNGIADNMNYTGDSKKLIKKM